MIKSSKLLAVMITLCLLFTLTGAALAQTAETPPKTAQTGNWPEEMIGSWVGLHEDLWMQFTFLRNGRFVMTVFEDPSMDRSGTSQPFVKDETVRVENGLLQLTAGGMTSAFRRVPEPYIRLQVKDGSITQTADRALLGTWGGRMGETYVEWTFSGEGGFTQLTPYEALREEGYYLAGGGSLAILLNGKLTACTYEAGENSMTADLPGAGKLILNKRYGLLTEMWIDETDEKQDFGWLRFLDREPKGPIVIRYLGSETEVGIPGCLAWTAVLGIGDGAFKENKTIKSVTVPDFVTQIGEAAFEGCESLRDVLLIGMNTDNGGTYVADYSIAGVTVTPGSCPLKTIGDAAFRGCTNLENLNLATSAVQSPHAICWWIGRSDSKGINIPDGVTRIGASAFEGCKSITSVTIPDSVTFIDKDAFKGCSRVTLNVDPDSYPMRYARRNGIPFILRGD